VSGYDPTNATSVLDLQPILRAEGEAPIIPRSDGLWRIAPAYAGIFAALPLLDRLGVWLGRDVAGGGPVRAGLGWTAASAVLAALACYGLLYAPPALWGYRSGRKLATTSASAFGTLGAEWLTGVGVALGAIVSYAVALHMALRLVFLGLVSCGLISPAMLQPMTLGPIVVESPVFVVTAAFWIFITGMAAVLRLPSVIFALMQVYTPVALVLLSATAALVAGGLPAFIHEAASSAGSAPGPASGLGEGPAGVFQILFGGFAFSGLFAVEWGMAAGGRRDIRIGGGLGVALAGSLATVLAIAIVAGALGREEVGPHDPFPAVDVLTAPFSLHWAILHGVGGKLGGAILMLFGLASLAPAVYAAWAYGKRLRDHWPALNRFRWTWVGSAPAFALVATSWAGRLETIFGLMGAVFAPMVGVLAADAVRWRLHWGGLRPGWHMPGLVAWACGLVAGLALRGRAEPASLLAYLTAAAVYLALTAVLPPRPLLAAESIRQSMEL
jgi:hypothetical protein